MFQHHQPFHTPVLDAENTRDTFNSKIDLVVLKYMAQKVLFALHSQEYLTEMGSPLPYHSKELSGRSHRIAIYQPEKLLQRHELFFVGFVSGKRKNISSDVIDSINQIDQQLVKDIIHVPGLFSYSSLQLRNGNWWNLVIISGIDVKGDIQSSQTHMHAAYRLAPQYYDWIRLHTGHMPGGLHHYGDMTLLKTKNYSFAGEHGRPSIREVIYGSTTPITFFAQPASQDHLQLYC